jgi:hypothetical protein
LATFFQIEGYRQLKGVQSSQPFPRAILHQQKPGSLEVTRLYGWTNQQTLLPEVRSQAAPGGLDLPFVDRACAGFDGENRLHLYHRQMGNDAARTRLPYNPTDEFGSCFLVI